ncbi:MAG: STAS domain-containing protein [Pseudomonadota bacterium]
MQEAARPALAPMAQTETQVDLPARSDLSSARHLRDAVLAGDGKLVLRAGDVEVLTSPVLQVLMAARRGLASEGRHIALTSASPAFDDCLLALGASRLDICTIDEAGGPR